MNAISRSCALMVRDHSLDEVGIRITREGNVHFLVHLQIDAMECQARWTGVPIRLRGSAMSLGHAAMHAAGPHHALAVHMPLHHVTLHHHGTLPLRHLHSRAALMLHLGGGSGGSEREAGNRQYDDFLHCSVSNCFRIEHALSESAVPLELLRQLIRLEDGRRVGQIRRHRAHCVRRARKKLSQQQRRYYRHVALRRYRLEAAETKAENLAVGSHRISGSLWASLTMLVMDGWRGGTARVVMQCAVRLCERHDWCVRQANHAKYRRNEDSQQFAGSSWRFHPEYVGNDPRCPQSDGQNLRVTP